MMNDEEGRSKDAKVDIGIIVANNDIPQYNNDYNKKDSEGGIKNVLFVNC